MIGYVLPTRDRPDSLRRTLDTLARLEGEDARGQVVVVDNASDSPPDLPERLDNGLEVVGIRNEDNRGAASRNQGVEALDPACAWAVLLDDDSAPEVHAGAISAALARQGPEVAAVMADIHLPASGKRESGGLPEVFIGCGVAVRRDAFLEAGGYDESFHYYAEEYDLAARFLLSGAQITFEPAFVVRHEKATKGRDFGVIIRRLVRNNGWVAARYAPDLEMAGTYQEVRTRYRTIAERENVLDSYERGLNDLTRSLKTQPRRPMPPAIWDRFTGMAHARDALDRAMRDKPFASAAIVGQGKNAWAVVTALDEWSVTLREPTDADTWVVGTMSPGPMIDAALAAAGCGKRVVLPWAAAASAHDAGAFDAVPLTPPGSGDAGDARARAPRYPDRPAA